MTCGQYRVGKDMTYIPAVLRAVARCALLFSGGAGVVVAAVMTA